MKHKGLKISLSILAITLATSIATTVATHKHFNETINENLEKISKNGLKITYKENFSSGITASGEVEFEITPKIQFNNKHKQKVIKGKLSANTFFLPFCVFSKLTSDSEITNALFKEYKIDEAELSSFFGNNELNIETKEDQQIQTTVSLWGFTQNRCFLKNAKLQFLQKNTAIATNFETDYLICDTPIGDRITGNEILNIENFKFSTTLNHLLDKNFNIKAPEYFFTSADRLTINAMGNSIKMKAVDLGRKVIDDGKLEKFYLNLFVDQGGILSKFTVDGIGDRFVTGESTGIKTGQYHFLMDGVLFPNIPYIKTLYKLGYVSEKGHIIESNVHYKVNLDLVNPLTPTLATPNAVKLTINGKETSMNEFLVSTGVLNGF